MSSSAVKLLEMMREQGSKNTMPYATLGVVKSINPFLVQINDLVLDKDDLYIASDLLEHSISGKIDIDATLNGKTQPNTCNCSFCDNTNHSHDLASATISGTFMADLESVFEPNDLVVVLPLKSKQKYILLNKVVALE